MDHITINPNKALYIFLKISFKFQVNYKFTKKIIKITQEINHSHSVRRRHQTSTT